MVDDRRDSYRFDVQKDEVHIENPPSLSIARISNISASGSRIILPSNQMDGLGKTPIELRLGNYPSFQTDILLTRMVEQDGLIRIGTRFGNLKTEELGVLARFLIDKFLEESRKYPFIDFDRNVSIIKRNQETILNLLRYYCIFQSYPLTIYDGDLRLPLVLEVRDLFEEGKRRIIQMDVRDGKTEILETDKEYTLTFPGTNAVYSFSTRVRQIKKTSFCFILPEYIRQYGFRDSLRVPLDLNQGIEFFIDPPMLRGVTLAKHVLEIGARGFSFPVTPEDDLLFPGEILKTGILMLPDGPIRIEGVIRSIRKHSGKLAYGVEIVHFTDQEEAMRWKRFVLILTYPELMIGKREHADAYWKVLKASNYIGKEVTPALRSIIKKRFFQQWEKHAENPIINQNLLYYKNEEAVGTFSMNLLYPKTGIGHHMSVDKRVRQSFFEIGRELFSGLQYIFRHLVTTEYYISYFYAEKTFNDLMFRRFFKKYPEKENFVYDRYNLYKCLLDARHTKPEIPLSDIDIKKANPTLLKILSLYLKKNLPKIEFEAFSYNEDEINLEVFSKGCSADGYERKRCIFFVVEGKRPLAALIAETGDIGVNTFNLLNCCWIVYLVPDAKQDDEVLERLMIQAIHFYTEEKKPEFLLLEYNDIPKERLEKYGIQYFTDGMRWLGNRDMLPAYLNYLEETLQMLYNRFRPH